MNITEETSLLSFKAICNFINDLSTEYGKRHKPLQLYNRLSSHTKISHDNAIKKHIGIFYNFCVGNRESFASQDSKKLVCKKLVYSERVYIDMEYIFQIADEDNTKVIWQHLLIISALLDSSGNAREILKSNLEKSENKNEDKFLSEIISKVQENVNTDSSNPMDAFSSVLQSGIMNDLMGNMQGGKMDIKKLLGAVKGVVSKLEKDVGSDPESKNAIGLVNNIIGSMGDGERPPDLAMMMKNMMSVMGAMSQQTQKSDLTVEEN